MKQEMQWHQLDHMRIICTLFQTDNSTSTSLLSFYMLDTVPGARKALELLPAVVVL